MHLYTQLQLNQAGSKSLIKNSTSFNEKVNYTLIYLFKIALTVAFCFMFVTLFSICFGNDNSIIGVVVLLYLLVYRNSHFMIKTNQSILLIWLFFLMMAIMPRLANAVHPLFGLGINILSIAVFILLGCSNPKLSNQSTLVLSYLLIYGYDVTGPMYQKRLIALFVGAILISLVFYLKHSKKDYPNTIKSTLKSKPTKWQLCQIICVPLIICILELIGIHRSMWAGIAAMSVMLPTISDTKQRVYGRIIGNILGVIIFGILYFTLPSEIYAYIGIIGGIGVGLSAKYHFQAIFNTFGALAIATSLYGLQNAMLLRIGTNVFGALFALVFCKKSYN